MKTEHMVILAALVVAVVIYEKYKHRIVLKPMTQQEQMLAAQNAGF